MYNNNFNQFYPYGVQQPMPMPPQTQPIQQFQQQLPQASCYFVKSIDELSGIRIMPNIYCMGINKDNKEIYVRRMNNDGNIEVETYSLKSESKEKSELEKITERLTNIENSLKEKNNEQFGKYVNQQPAQQQAQYYASNATTASNV